MITSSTLKEEIHKWAHQADNCCHINPDVPILQGKARGAGMFILRGNWNVICNYNRVNNSQEKSWCRKKRGINWSLVWKLEAVSQALEQFGCRTANCSIWSKETQPTMLWTRHSTPATPRYQGGLKLKCILCTDTCQCCSDREQKKKLLIKVSHSLESRVTTLMVVLDII